MRKADGMSVSVVHTINNSIHCFLKIYENAACLDRTFYSTCETKSIISDIVNDCSLLAFETLSKQLSAVYYFRKKFDAWQGSMNIEPLVKLFLFLKKRHPGVIYLFKVNSKNHRIIRKICSKLTMFPSI